MTELQEPRATRALSTPMKREDWLNSRNEARKLWIAQHRRIGSLTLTGAVRGKRDWFITWQCDCGKEGRSRWSDLKERAHLNASMCKACVRKHRNETMTLVEREKMQRNYREYCEKMQRVDPEWTALRKICNGAKDRCNNPKCEAYANYGGRGVEFRFSGGAEMANWVLQNLGQRPSKNHSIDRVDNDGHYEPGNLRWATRAEQNSNKRCYKVGALGERIRYLIAHTSYGYESLRTFIKEGMTNDEIINRQRRPGGRPRSTNRTSVRLNKRRGA